MAVRGLNLDWSRHKVSCFWCAKVLSRRLYHPETGIPITNFFCDRVCKGDWQKTQKPVDEAWLRQKYEIEGLRAPDIAKIVNRNSKQVWHWLKGYGIETHRRGHNPELQFQPGHAGFTGHHSEETKGKLRAARLADGHFPKNPDGSPYWKGKSGPLHPVWDGGHTPERQAFYNTDGWKRACVAVWHRADARCERCGLDSRTVATKQRKFAVHHVVSFKVKELRSDPTNLRLLCRPCHLWVHSKANVTKELRG